MKKFALRGLIILAIVVALCIFFSGTVRTLTTPKVRFAQAKMGKFEQSTSLTGKVVFPAEEEIHVAVPEGMHLTVTRVKATAGDKVKAGDLLAAAKVTDADKTLESLRKDYETARSSLRSLEKKTGEIHLSRSEQRWQDAWEAEQEAMQAERDARVNLQVLLRQKGLEMVDGKTLPEGAGDEEKEAWNAWQAAGNTWQKSQESLKALERYAIPEDTWNDLQKMKEYRKTMADAEEKMTDLEILKKQAESITAPHAGYISQVSIEKGSSVDGDTVIMKMTPADNDPVIRAELGDMKLTVEKGTGLYVESDSWGRTETKVVDTGLTLEGHPYVDCQINKDVRYALGSVTAMMKNDIKLTLSTKNKESTCLLPASAVRGSGSDRYVYTGERVSSTFGGSQLKCKKTPVTVLGESGSTVSLAEDLSNKQVLYMEDRALSEDATVMSYEGN
ncbi:MAG: hypothetical protein IKE25_00055 [Clostridia bacterium]|nr:hypothetical protein [Clostridia bacterium]